MTRKEFIFVFVLIILSLIFISIAVHAEPDTLVTSDMQLYRTHFKVNPQGKITEVLLFFYKDNKFYRIYVYGGDTFYKGYMYIKDKQLFFKDRYGNVWKYNPKKIKGIPKTRRL